MKCPACGGVELLHETRDIPYCYKGECTTIPQISGDFCPVCGEAVLDLEDGERYSTLIAQFHNQVRDRLGISEHPEPMRCPACGDADLEHDTRDVVYSYLGESITIQGVTGEHCDACGESITGWEEGGRITRAMTEFTRKVDAHHHNSNGYQELGK